MQHLDVHIYVHMSGSLWNILHAFIIILIKCANYYKIYVFIVIVFVSFMNFFDMEMDMELALFNIVIY